MLLGITVEKVEMTCAVFSNSPCIPFMVEAKPVTTSFRDIEELSCLSGCVNMVVGTCQDHICDNLQVNSCRLLHASVEVGDYILS